MSYILIKTYESCTCKIRIFNKCLANHAIHLKEQILCCFIFCFSYIILSRLSIILICSLSDPLAVQQLTSKGNSLFICSFHHKLHLMPSGSIWSFHDLHNFYLLCDEFIHFSISHVSINSRSCLCHRPEKRNS